MWMSLDKKFKPGIQNVYNLKYSYGNVCGPIEPATNIRVNLLDKYLLRAKYWELSGPLVCLKVA